MWRRLQKKLPSRCCGDRSWSRQHSLGRPLCLLGLQADHPDAGKLGPVLPAALWSWSKRCSWCLSSCLWPPTCSSMACTSWMLANTVTRVWSNSPCCWWIRCSSCTTWPWSCSAVSAASTLHAQSAALHRWRQPLLQCGPPQYSTCGLVDPGEILPWFPHVQHCSPQPTHVHPGQESVWIQSTLSERITAPTTQLASRGQWLQLPHKDGKTDIMNTAMRRLSMSRGC